MHLLSLARKIHVPTNVQLTGYQLAKDNDNDKRINIMKKTTVI
jgi:hypothetical protein